MVCIFVGSTVSPAGEEDSGGHIHKRKRKRKKRNHFQPDTQDLDAATTPTVPSADSEPDAAQRQAPQACVTEPTAEAVSSIGENSSEPTPIMPIRNKRKRSKRKNLRAHREIWKSTTLPQEDMSKNDTVGSHPQSSSAHISSPESVQARKRKRKLGPPPVSSGDLIVQKAGTPTSSVEGNDGQTTQPWCKRLQKKIASSTLEPCDLSSQKTAVSKKREKMKHASNGVLESSAGQNQALVRREGPRVQGRASVAVLGGPAGCLPGIGQRERHTSAKQCSGHMLYNCSHQQANDRLRPLARCSCSIQCCHLSPT